MEELRFALLIFGGCAIVAILAHGLWSLRKNAKPAIKPRVEPSQVSNDKEGFDEYGLGEVRIIATDENSADADSAEPVVNTNTFDEPESVIDEGVEPAVEASASEPDFSDGLDESSSSVQIETEDADKQMSSAENESADETQQAAKPEEPKKLYGSVISNPKPGLKSTYRREDNRSATTSETPVEPIPEPPSFLLQSDDIKTRQPTANQDDSLPEFSLDQAPSEASVKSSEPVEQPADTSGVSEPSVNIKRSIGRKKTARKRVEPSIGKDQMRIDFDDTATANVSDEQVDASDTPTAEQEVLVLNVRAPNDAEISGAALLPMLLTLGFKFGDQDIFHRHVNSNGKGPVLFSLANMFKPGVFDIDNLENFTTKGVSLFMILPIEGDPHQVFNMMHNAARKLAEEFSCQILDGRRSVLTKQGLQQYVEKIREFERQRMISRH